MLIGFVFRRREIGGGGKGIRTPDLLIANETLYQLSYDPTAERTTVNRSFQEASGKMAETDSRGSRFELLALSPAG